MTTKLPNWQDREPTPVPLALKSNLVLGPTPPLVERLRQCVTMTHETALMREAADEIERLQTTQPRSGMREHFLEQERDEARRGLVAIRTQVANALTDLDDGNDDDAMEMLRAIAGLGA